MCLDTWYLANHAVFGGGAYLEEVGSWRRVLGFIAQSRWSLGWKEADWALSLGAETVHTREDTALDTEIWTISCFEELALSHSEQDQKRVKGRN